MKVALIYPNIAGLGFFCAGQEGDYQQDMRQKPLGLLYLASALQKRGDEVSVLDLRFLTGFWDLDQRLKQIDPDVVGITIMTPSRDYAFRCAEIAKAHNSQVVGGGVYATCGHEDMLENGRFDYVITGEGDLSFPELVGRLEKGKQPAERLIRGKRPHSLDGLPFPEVRLYDMEFYSRIPGWEGFRTPATGMICSRGCPAQCTFCKPLSEEMFGRRLRFRSISNIMEEVRWYVEDIGIKTIHFYDDTFTINRKLVLEFCDRMAHAGYDVDWTINTRSNCLDEEMAAALKRGGCKMLSFGFESGSQRILNFLKKGITVEQSIRAAEICHKYGFRFLANLLVGIPGETEEDLEANYRFIRRIRPDIVYYNNLVPFPGTAIRDYCEEKGLLKPIHSFDQYFSHPGNEPLHGVDYDRMRRWGEIIQKGRLLHQYGPAIQKIERLTGRGFSWLRKRLRERG